MFVYLSVDIKKKVPINSELYYKLYSFIYISVPSFIAKIKVKETKI